MKKQIILGMATLMFAGMMTDVSATGASKDTSVPVSYDNRNAVVDPDNPALAEWGVSIPTAIAFSKGTTSQAVDVELMALNGAVLSEFTDSFKVSVKAASTNGMTLNAGSEEIGYTVTYDQASLGGTTATEIALLTKAADTKAGTASLGTDKATKLSMYTDTLTYTIQKTAD